MNEHIQITAVEAMRSVNIDQERKRGIPFRYHVLTYGCQMNEHDSEVLAGILDTMGFVPSSALEGSDIILINTCCVRESAEEKIYGKIGSLKALKEINPDLIIGVCGCMAQKPDEVKKIKRIAPFVDLILGADTMQSLPDALVKVYQGSKSSILVSSDEYRSIAEKLPRRRHERHKAWVSVMHGCNNFCSYCIVPYVRGRERSRNPDDIIFEVRSLCEDGVKEVTLLGQNVNSYGRGLAEPIDFADLLSMIEPTQGLERIRFMTSHPKDLSLKLIDTMAKSEHICNHIHLPVQAGSNRVLESMNRGYTREEYARLVVNIRKAMPECSITTDIIVGFPGENESDFEETLSLASQIRWNAAYTFLYSNRSGTSAATMTGQIEEDVKKARLQRLMTLQNTVSLEANQAFVGRTVNVMVEGTSRTNPDVWSSRTTTNHLVLFPKTKDQTQATPGDIVSVIIESAKTWTLHGRTT